MAIHKGIRIHQYLDDWLVRARSHQACLQHTQDLVKMCQQLGWLVNLDKSELEPQQVFNFVGYQFNLKSDRVRPTPDRWQNFQEKILEMLSHPACPVRQFMSLIGLLTATEKQVHLGRLHLRPIQWHLKNNWTIPESLEKVIPLLRSLHPHLQWWLEEDNVLTGQPQATPNKACSANIYRRIKRGVGRSLKRAHCKRNLVTSRKQAAYKLPRTQSSFSSFKRVPGPLFRQDSSCSNGQHHSGVIHKQRRRHDVGPTVCPSVENLDLVHQETSFTQSPTHSRPSERSSRQAIKTGPDHPNRVVSPSRGFPNNMQQVAQAQDRPICHEVLQQVTSVCVTHTDPLAWAVDALSLLWEDLDVYAFPPVAILGKVVEKLQDHPCHRIILIAQGGPTCLGSGI